MLTTSATLKSKWLLLFKESIVKKAFTAMFLGAVIWIPIFYKIFVG